MTSIAQPLFRGQQFLHHWLRAVDAHSLHAPFSYKFYTEVIKAPHNDLLKPLQKLRAKVLKDKGELQVTDLGAGDNRPTTRVIGHLARTSHRPKVARMLYRLVQFTGAQNILELGTNLGLTTQHLALASPAGRIITIEACPQLCKQAQKYFQQLGLGHIELIQGDIDEKLMAALNDMGQLDLLFLDANHRYEATRKYFNTSVKFIHPGSVMVLDDIHWSPGMSRAWNEIIEHQAVTLSLDLFQVGILFFNPELKKDHLILEF